jgi:hypothetical protein
MNKVILSILLLIISVICKSQTADSLVISADRPGMATPPGIIPSKKFQIESGFSDEKINTNKLFQETTQYNTTLFRYGISNSSEIRVQTDYARLKTTNSNITGFDPLTIGTKLTIIEGKGVLPKTSFLFNLTLPYLGNKNFRPDNMAPSFYLLFQNNLTDKLNLCYNIGLEYDGSSPSPSDFMAICMGYAISDKLSCFIENYNWFSNVLKPLNYFDLGCAYLIRKNLQFDVSANFSLQNFDNYNMYNFGLSWMFPNRSK